MHVLVLDKYLVLKSLVFGLYIAFFAKRYFKYSTICHAKIDSALFFPCWYVVRQIYCMLIPDVCAVRAIMHHRPWPRPTDRQSWLPVRIQSSMDCPCTSLRSGSHNKSLLHLSTAASVDLVVQLDLGCHSWDETCMDGYATYTFHMWSPRSDLAWHPSWILIA